MIMDERCPHCGSTEVETSIDYEERDSYTSVIVTYYGRCIDCGKDFFMSEVLAVTSRIVAKDIDELDELIKKEEEEENRDTA